MDIVWIQHLIYPYVCVQQLKLSLILEHSLQFKKLLVNIACCI